MKTYLNEKTVAEYLKTKGLYDTSADLTVLDLHAVKESIDGYVNLIFLIRDTTGRSMVLKQIVDLPRSRSEDTENVKNPDDLKEWTLDIARLRTEISVLIFYNSLMPGICPDIYLFDEAEGILVMEDLSDHSLLRYDHCRMRKHPDAAAHLGTFFARNLFYGSDLHLTAYKKEQLKKFFSNPEYNALEFFLFEDCSIVSDNRLMPDETWPLRQKLLNSPSVQQTVARLHHDFMNNAECLIHTDLHASNIMVKDSSIKIIDTEFAGFGPIAQDIGRLLASYLLNYLSWFGDKQADRAASRDFQLYLLKSIETLLTCFFDEFRKLCQDGEKDSYALQKLDVDSFLADHFTDILQYLALNAGSRIANRGLCHDFERLPEADRIQPINLALSIIYSLITETHQYRTVNDLIDYLEHFMRSV